MHLRRLIGTRFLTLYRAASLRLLGGTGVPGHPTPR